MRLPAWEGGASLGLESVGRGARMTESIDGRRGRREAIGRCLVTGGDLCLATSAGGALEVDSRRSSWTLKPRRLSRRCGSISSVCALLCERMRSLTLYPHSSTLSSSDFHDLAVSVALERSKAGLLTSFANPATH